MRLSGGNVALQPDRKTAWFSIVIVGISVIILVHILFLPIFFMIIFTDFHPSEIVAVMTAFTLIFGLRYLVPVLSVLLIVLGALSGLHQPRELKRLAIITGALGIVGSIISWIIAFSW